MTSRLRSLDVFRGATVALMILVNNPGSWSHLYPPLAHAPWHGVTPTDLVFPFFLFAVGNALALQWPRWEAGSAAAFWSRTARRTALIFGIGLFLNLSPFVRWDAAGELVPRSLDALRLMGVLQRIALAFGAAAALLWLCGARRALALAAALLLGYWAACLLFATGPDPYSLEGFFGTALDRALLGANHLYRGEGVPFDPEGLASTLPAIAQVLIGFAAGRWVAAEATPTAALRLFLAATALLVLAYAWQLAMPFNKKIWTSSYVLLTSGAAMMALAACLHLVDGPAEGERRATWGWASFCEVFGRNPLFIFVLSGFVPRVLALCRWPAGTNPDGSPAWTSPLPWLAQQVFAPLGRALSDDPRFGSLLFALFNLAAYWALAWGLDRRRVYLRV